jgi:transaldolase
MKLFLDTAKIDELKAGAALGIVDGVTTNPSLMAATGRSMTSVVKEIVEIIDGPISVETLSLDADGMVKEGKEYAAIHKNIVVKCPMTKAGVQATRRLADAGLKVNVTLVFSAGQALLAAKAGATFVSPFIGRIDDIGLDGMALIRDIVTIFKNFNFKTEILAASIRHPQHCLMSALAGAHVATMPLKVLEQMYNHPLTTSGLEKFMADWKAAEKRV